MEDDGASVFGRLRPWDRMPNQTMELLAAYHRWYKEEKFRWGNKWEDNNDLYRRVVVNEEVDRVIKETCIEIEKRDGKKRKALAANIGGRSFFRCAQRRTLP